MLFVRANSIVLLLSIFFNPIIATCDALGVRANNGPAMCNTQSSTKDEEILAQDYCQNLNKHVAILQQFNDFNKKHNIVDFGAQNNTIFNVKNIEYKNEIIKICIAKMVEQKSLEPFFKTWEYAYSLCISNKDIGFVREFSIVIFSLYEGLLTTILSKKVGEYNIQGTRSLLEDIIQVYNAVSELPIKDIIITLEKCYVLFSKILNDYGIGSGLTFRQWITKYWWLPPTIIIAILGAFLRKKISKEVGYIASKFYYLNKDKKTVSDKK